MNQLLETAARGMRYYAEMLSIIREVADLDMSYCPFCHTPHGLGHDTGCSITRARCLLVALDTPEQRHARYLDSRTSEETD
jgi:hypothetical protein